MNQLLPHRTRPPPRAGHPLRDRRRSRPASSPAAWRSCAPPTRAATTTRHPRRRRSRASRLRSHRQPSRASSAAEQQRRLRQLRQLRQPGARHQPARRPELRVVNVFRSMGCEVVLPPGVPAGRRAPAVRRARPPVQPLHRVVRAQSRQRLPPRRRGRLGGVGVDALPRTRRRSRHRRACHPRRRWRDARRRLRPRLLAALP